MNRLMILWSLLILAHSSSARQFSKPPPGIDKDTLLCLGSGYSYILTHVAEFAKLPTGHDMKSNNFNCSKALAIDVKGSVLKSVKPTFVLIVTSDSGKWSIDEKKEILRANAGN